MLQSASKRGLLAAIVMSSVAMCAHADSTIFDSEGFETYTDGNLVGQNSWTTLSAGPGSAAVQATSGVGGSKGVLVTKGSVNREYLPASSTIDPLEQFVKISWDMNVTENVTATDFGPLFGIDAFAGSNRLALFGVDASTGEILTVPEGGGPYVALPVTVTLGEWHNYAIFLDYTNFDASLYIDGSLEAYLNYFVSGDNDEFSDADIISYLADNNSNPPGTAFYDNFSILNVNAVPEPLTGATMSLASLLLLRRRSR